VIEVLDAARALLNQRTEPQAERLCDALERTKAQLEQNYRPTWYEDLLSEFNDSDKPFVELILAQAVESLL
jgi:hypothetical protein